MPYAKPRHIMDKSACTGQDLLTGKGDFPRSLLHDKVFSAQTPEQKSLTLRAHCYY
jgi:hypothetical protein